MTNDELLITNYQLPTKIMKSSIERTIIPIGFGLALLALLGSAAQVNSNPAIALWAVPKAIALCCFSLSVVLFVVVYYCLNHRIAQLQQLQAQLQDLYSNAPCGYLSLDKDGTFIAINDTALSWLGYSRDEAIAKLKFADLLTPESVAIFQKNFRSFLEPGGVKDLEFQLIRKDGSILPVLLNTTAIRDSAGNFVATRTSIFDISEHKQALEALRKSEERFRLAVDNIPSSFVIYDRERRFEFVNAEGLRRTRLPIEAFIGRTDEEIHPPEVTEKYLPILQRAVETRSLQSTECTITLPTTDTFTTVVTYVPLLDERGEIYQILSITHDLTQRKRAEQALRESEERLRLALEAAHMGTWDWNILTNHITWSSDPQQLFGLATGTFDATYEALEACLYSDDRKSLMQAMNRARKEQRNFKHEFRLVGPDGSIHWVEGKGKFFYDETGQAVRMVGTIMDICDRRQREEQLRLLESVVVNSNDAVIITEAEPIDPPGPRIVYVNPAFTRMTGYALEEVMGLTPRILQGAKSDRATLERMHAALQTWQPIQVDLINYRKDGSEFWVELSIVPVANEKGWFTHWIAVQRDISDRKHAEENLRQVNEELEIRVQERTAELKQANERLQRELFERQLVEQALSRAYQHLQFHVENTPLAVVEWNQGFRLMNWSKQAEKIFGWTLEEVIGKHPHEWRFIYEEDAQRVNSVMERLLNGSQPSNLSCHRNYTKNGTVIDCEWYNSALFDASGNLVSILSLIQDVTERKQAEVARRESQEQLQAILDNSSAVIYLTDTSHRYLLVNRRYETLFDMTREQIQGKRLYEVWSPEIADAFAANNQKVLEGRVPIEVEEVASHEDGLHTYITTKFPLYDANGVPYAVCGISTDITERKGMEEALRESERRFRAIFNSSFQFVGLLKPDGTLLEANQTALDFAGLNQSEVVGRPFWELRWWTISSAIQNRLKAAIAKAASGEFVRYEVEVRGAGDTVTTVDFSLKPVKNEQGNVVLLISEARDISDRKRAEEALRNAYDELELRVTERTKELAKANDELKIENAERKRVEAELNTRAQQQAAVAELGQEALAGKPLATLMNQAVAAITQILDVEYCKVLELLPDGKALLLRAGVGWREGLVGQATVSVGLDSQVGYTLLSSEPVIVEDLHSEVQLVGPPLLHEHNVISGMSVIIAGQNRPYGVLGAHTSRRRKFTEDDIHFLQATANVLATAIARQHAEEALRRTHDELEIRVQERTTDLEKANAELQQKIIELQLSQEERAKLIAILEATPDIVATASVDERIFYLNSAARKVFGFGEKEDFTHFTFADAHPEWAYEIVRNEAIPVAMRDGVWMGETAVCRGVDQYTPTGAADGKLAEEIPVSQVFIAHKSPDGSLKMLSTVARDITQQKKIAATLSEAERRWRSLLENVRLVVVGLDNNGNIEYVNSFFLELVGYSAAEVFGKDWFDTFAPPHQSKPLRNSFLEMLQQKLYYHTQNVILTKCGEERTIAWNNTLLQDSEGNVIGTLSIGEDVTERRVIERMKDEFISVVSHELRTPLTSIHGALNLLSSGLVDTQSDKGRRVIEIAAQSAERLVRLVNDILELERLESGKISLLKQTCNASELLVKATEMIQVMANRAGVTLAVFPQAIELYADPDRIIQLLTNLLGNAIKFSPRGSTVWLTVELETGNWELGTGDKEDEEDKEEFTTSNLSPLSALSAPSPLSPQSPIPNPTVLFKVKDQGRGIPTDKLESIFERFHQVDASDSRKKGGTGLGLAICRSIVQQHGGRIWVESTLGEGSCFYFTLPQRSTEEGNHDNKENLSD
jgi:PAS domain S-box-containing protein